MKFRPVACSALLLALFFAPHLAAAAEPQWIWGTENANQSAPAGSCHFRREFDLGQPESGRIDITCDNRYVLRVNSRLVGASNNWQVIDRYDVTSLLVQGKNVIDVRSVNDDQAAGLAARVIVKAEGEAALDLSTDKNWQVYLQAGRSWNPAAFASMKPSAVFTFGPLGKAAPWGQKFQVSDVVRRIEAPKHDAAQPFELRDGDRVVLVGNTLIERAQSYGYLETALTAHYPERNIIFRNLGWSGDTVFGHARARFGSVGDGFQHLVEHVYALKPTVLLVGYGTNESFAGEAGLPSFLDGLDKLLDVLEATGARVVLLSPLRQENLGPPLPDPSAHNKDVQLYSGAIAQTAEDRGHLFVNLFDLLGQEGQPSGEIVSETARLTDNGLHLDQYGYWRAGAQVFAGLGLELPRTEIALDIAAGKEHASGGKLSDVNLSRTSAGFTLLASTLPYPQNPRPGAPSIAAAPQTMLRVTGLAPGRYVLSIDGKAVAKGTDEQFAAGVAIAEGPSFDQVEKLRQAILAKNELYFHRWRPQNETYLYLFRKHEQGNNAREIPQFDPLIAEREKTIAALRTPTSHRYTLTREEN